MVLHMRRQLAHARAEDVLRCCQSICSTLSGPIVKYEVGHAGFQHPDRRLLSSLLLVNGLDARLGMIAMPEVNIVRSMVYISTAQNF